MTILFVAIVAWSGLVVTVNRIDMPMPYEPPEVEKEEEAKPKKKDVKGRFRLIGV